MNNENKKWRVDDEEDDDKGQSYHFFHKKHGNDRMKPKEEFMAMVSKLHDDIAPMSFCGGTSDWIRKRRFIKELKKKW